MTWAAGMALALDAGVPWVMCKQTDAPENIVRTHHLRIATPLNFFKLNFLVINNAQACW